MVADCAQSTQGAKKRQSDKNLKGTTKLFSIERGFQGIAISHIISNGEFKDTLFFVADLIVEIIGQGILFWFVFHEDPFSVEGGPVRGYTAQVIRDICTQVPVVGQPLFILEVFGAYARGNGILSRVYVPRSFVRVVKVFPRLYVVLYKGTPLLSNLPMNIWRGLPLE